MSSNSVQISPKQITKFTYRGIAFIMGILTLITLRYLNLFLNSINFYPETKDPFQSIVSGLYLVFIIYLIIGPYFYYIVITNIENTKKKLIYIVLTFFSIHILNMIAMIAMLMILKV